MQGLISRSALLKNKTRMTEYDESGCGVHVFVVKEEDVLDAPAVDAEVVRHGRWIAENIRKKSYLRQCSACSKIAYFCGTGCSYTYCPNCGAKMDAEVEG